MKLHTVFITHNRLELTKQTIESYMQTVTVPHEIWVVDNASTDGTVEWLEEWASAQKSIVVSIFNKKNLYPGSATNKGWSCHAADATHLQRSDNDMEYLPGWCEEVQYQFLPEKVGQVGLRTDAEDEYARNTGGNCVIRRELWDKGLRYDERPWPQIRKEVGDGYSEDSFFSRQVERLGYTWTRVRTPCVRNLASGDWSDEYYRVSYGVRGIKPHPDDPTVPEGFIPYGS